MSTNANDLLKQAIAAGLTFGTCVEVFAAQPDPDATEDREAIIERARDEHQSDGEVEIDDPTIVSWSSDGGAYVMAWVWVDGKEVVES